MRFLLIIAVLWIWAAPSRANGPNADSYDNEQFGFSLRRPSADWVWKLPDQDSAQLGSKVASINGNSQFQLMFKLVRDPKQNDETVSNVTADYFAHNATDGDATSYARLFAESMRPNDGGYKLLEPAKAIPLGGRTGAITELEATLRKKDAAGNSSQYLAHVRAIFVLIDESWVRFILSVRQSDWKTAEPEFRQITESVHFQPPAPASTGPKDEVLDGLKF